MLKSKKWALLTSCMDYHSIDVCPGRFIVSTKTIDAIRGLEIKTNITELRSLLVLCSWLLPFCVECRLCGRPVKQNSMKRSAGGFQDLSDNEIIELEMLRNLVELSLSRLSGDSTVKHRTGQSDWLCPSIKATRQSRETNLILSRLVNDAERSYNMMHCKCLEVELAVWLLQPNHSGWLHTVCSDHNDFSVDFSLMNSTWKIGMLATTGIGTGIQSLPSCRD